MNINWDNTNEIKEHNLAVKKDGEYIKAHEKFGNVYYLRVGSLPSKNESNGKFYEMLFVGYIKPNGDFAPYGKHSYTVYMGEDGVIYEKHDIEKVQCQLYLDIETDVDLIKKIDLSYDEWLNA